MGRIHVSSTLEIPVYQRLEAFARDRGIVHQATGEINLADALRQALALALVAGDEGDAGKGDHEPAND